MAVMFAIFAAAAGHEAYAVAQERSWPVVTASVSSVELRKGCDKGVGYNVRISYAYRSRDGVAGAGATERPINGCVDQGTALSVVKDYAVGTTLKVNVNPADPQASIDAFELANDAPMLAMMLSSAGSLALIAIAITRGRHAGRRPDRTAE